MRRLSNLSLIIYSIWFWQDISNPCCRRSPHFHSLASISNLLFDGTNAGECSSTSYGIFLPPIIPRDERSTDPADLGCTCQTVWRSPPTSRGSLGNISRVAWLMLGTCTDQNVTCLTLGLPSSLVSLRRGLNYRLDQFQSTIS